MEITLPDAIGVMTLPGITFFPQAMLPLHIFEERYKQMLQQVLEGHRMFAIAGINMTGTHLVQEPPHRIATIGLVRACQKREDDTYNVLLQGMTRIELMGILQEKPFRVMRARPLPSEQGASEETNIKLHKHVRRLIASHCRLKSGPHRDFPHFIRTIDDPEIMVDVVAFNLVDDLDFKQKLLEGRSLHERLCLLRDRLKRENTRLRLARKLQGPLHDGDIPLN